MEYSLREWHGNDGLPDEVVHAVAQDERGYLWVVTEAGVVRFNGIRFDVPTLSSGTRSDTTARGIPAVVRHPEYGMLFAFSVGEIWQARSGELRLANEITALFSKARIGSWFAQADGALWAEFTDGKIEVLRGGRVTKVKLGDAAAAGRPVSFADDGGGGVWIGARDVLYHFREGDQAQLVAGNLGDGEIRIASSRRGKPWIITRDVVGRWDGGKIVSEVQIQRLLGAHFVHDCTEDRDGNLWVGTRSQGAYVVKADGSGYVVVPTSHRTVRDICEDREGNVWLATNGGGLDRLQAKLYRLFDSKAGLRDDITFAVCEDGAGHMWFANRDGGAARLKNGKLELMAERSGWPSGAAGRVYPALDGGVWYTGGASLYKVSASDNIPRAISATPIKNIRIMFVSAKNELWLGGDSGEIGRLDADGVRYTSFGADAGFPPQRVSCITEDGEGRIIVGTNIGNLFVYDARASSDVKPEARFRPMRAAYAKPFSPVRTVVAEKSADGFLWVGTGGAGVYVITPDGRELHIDTSTGLPDNLISQILFDDHGRVWFGSSHGIFSVERREIEAFVAGRVKSVHATAFGQNEGLEHISCLNGYQPDCWKSSDGTLWFTTRRGVLAIDPQVLRSSGKPPVFIDEMRVDDKPVAFENSGEIKIRSHARKLEFLFSALNFSAPERTPIRYRMDGFDEQWLSAGAARNVVYPRLFPGEYRLRIEAADEDGAWNETGATLAVTVVPFWWETPWFRAGVTLALAALLVVGARAWTYRRLRRKLERIERESALNRERTRIARDIHDDLGASLTRISLLSQSAPPAPEDNRACLEEIYTATSSITRSVNEIVWAIDARHDNLESLVSYFDSYAQRFLTVAKIRYRFHAPNEIPDIVVSSRVRHDLFLAFKEALNNCVKYAAATEVVVSIEIDRVDDMLNITITDNGRGLHTAKTSATTRDSGGQGLPNLALRLAEIHGKAVVRDGKNGGTEVALTVPINSIAS